MGAGMAQGGFKNFEKGFLQSQYFLRKGVSLDGGDWKSKPGPSFTLSYVSEMAIICEDLMDLIFID